MYMPENGRPVHQSLAYRSRMKRTTAVADFVGRQLRMGREDLRAASFKTSKIHSLAGDVPSTVAPAFDYPIFVGEKEGVVIDSRGIRNSQGEVSNREEYSNQCMEALIEYYWCTDIGRFKGISNIVAAAYGNWIASSFRRRFGADISTQSGLRAYFALFYMLQFRNAYEYTDMNKDDVETTFFKLTTGTFRIPQETAEIIFDAPEMQEIANHVSNWDKNAYDDTLFDRFCEAVPALFPELRISRFDAASMVEVVEGNFWIGPRRTDMAIAALTHPPTLMTTMVIADIVKSRFEKTVIGQVTKNLKMVRLSVGDLSRLVRDSIADQEDLFELRGYERL